MISRNLASIIAGIPVDVCGVVDEATGDDDLETVDHVVDRLADVPGPEKISYK